MPSAIPIVGAVNWRKMIPVCDSEENLDTRQCCEPVGSCAPILRGINTVVLNISAPALSVERHTLVAPPFHCAPISQLPVVRNVCSPVKLYVR
jgi:hypothetical protein